MQSVQTPTLEKAVKGIFTVLSNIILKGKIYIPRKVISAIAYVLVPAILFAIYIIPTHGIKPYEDIGEYAEILLLVTMFVKPVAVVFNRIGVFRTILGFRRQLGVTTFYFALFHFLMYAVVRELDILSALQGALGTVGFKFYGAIALLLMLVLYVTSNNISKKTLGKAWAWIQRLGYLLLPLVFIHSSLVEGEGFTKPVLVTLAFIVAKIAEKTVPKWRRKRKAATKAPAKTAHAAATEPTQKNA